MPPPAPVPAPAPPPPAPAPAPVPVAPVPAPAPAPAPEPVAPLIINDEDPLIPTELSSFRTGTPLVDIPRSVSIYTEERIDDQAVTSIGEIVDYTPGVTNSQGEGHRDSVVFRGVRSTADFFIDGFRDDVQYYRSLYNIDQVEILRGPSALHFGRGGVGGVINRITKKPVFGEASAKGYTSARFFDVSTSIDTFGANNTEFDWNYDLSDTVAFRLNGFYEYVNNHRDFYEGDRYGINPTFAFQLSPDTRLDFSYEFNNHDRFIDRGIPSANGFPVFGLAGTTFGDQTLNQNDFDSHTFRAIINHEFSDNWKGRLSAFYGLYNKTYSNYFPSDYDAATNQVEIDGYIDTVTRDRFSFAGDLVGNFSTGSIDHKVILGADFNLTNSDAFRFNNVWQSNGDDQQFFNAANFALRGGRIQGDVGAFTDLNDNTFVDIGTYSFYAQDEIAVTDKFDVVLGARFDSFDIDVFNAVNGETRSRTDSQVSPRAGLIFKPTEQMSIYGSYSESFLPRSGEQFANIDGDNSRLDADTFSNLELGFNFDIDEKLSMRMAVYHIEQTRLEEIGNTDTFAQVNPTFTGYEAQLTGYITDRWYLSGGYNYIEGTQEDDTGNTGFVPRELPEHQFSLWNKFSVSDKLGLGLGIIHLDDQFADGVGDGANEVVLPSYTRVDAAAYYKLSDDTLLQFNLENLFDEEYFPNSHTNHNISVGKPINATFSVKKRF